MRLIGDFQIEKQAFNFQIFLQNHGIKSLYDSAGPGVYRVWVVEEDDIDKALEFYQEWQKNPVQTPPQETKIPISDHPHWKVRMEPPRLKSPFLLNNFLIILCGFLFFWTVIQVDRLKQQNGPIAPRYELISLQKALFFDIPASLEAIEQFLDENQIKTDEDLKALSPGLQEQFKKLQKAPEWNGVASMVLNREWSLYQELPPGTLFGKIRQGEVWRLFSPVLLHGGLLHLIFNMLWLFILGRQIEDRLGKTRYLFLSLLLGIFSNVAQYLVSGFDFLGYSGIVVGMVGFIWMRQKVAPWEGYPLQRPVIIFISIFVVAMLALEVFNWTLQFFHLRIGGANIANTAHVIGGVFGALLGKLSLFERGPS